MVIYLFLIFLPFRKEWIIFAIYAKFIWNGLELVYLRFFLSQKKFFFKEKIENLNFFDKLQILFLQYV